MHEIARDLRSAHMWYYGRMLDYHVSLIYARQFIHGVATFSFLYRYRQKPILHNILVG